MVWIELTSDLEIINNSLNLIIKNYIFVDKYGYVIIDRHVPSFQGDQSIGGGEFASQQIVATLLLFRLIQVINFEHF